MEPPLVYVALNLETDEANLRLVDELREGCGNKGYGLKIDLDEALDTRENASNAYEKVSRLVRTGLPIFADLKLRQGATTMSNLARGFSDLGVDMINMYHAEAGQRLTEKVLRSVEATGVGTKLIGMTVLTHNDDEHCQRVYGRPIGEVVRDFGFLAREYGLSGFVLPPTQLEQVSDLDMFKVTPAIRPEFYRDKKSNDQEQIATPLQAKKGGSNCLVIGGPIIKPEAGQTSVGNLKSILKELM